MAVVPSVSFRFFVAYMDDGSRWGFGLTSEIAKERGLESLAYLYPNAKTDEEDRVLLARAVEALEVADMSVTAPAAHILPIVGGLMDCGLDVAAKNLDLGGLVLLPAEAPGAGAADR